MSTQRGNDSRSRPPKYQNKTVYKKDLHGTTPQTKSLDSLKIEGLCRHCTSVIEWKLKFKKYKKLAAPTKCAKCLQKTVKDAYHTWCRECAGAASVCPKCCQGLPVDRSSTTVTSTVSQNVEHPAGSPQVQPSSVNFQSSDEYGSTDDNADESSSE